MRQTRTVVQTPLSRDDDAVLARPTWWVMRNPLRKMVARWLNRDLAPDRQISLQIAWPLWLLPLVLLNQLIAPHVVWVVLLIALCGFYVVGYFWVRVQTPALTLTRRRVGSILVAGDLLQEEFELKNSSPLPLLWAELHDDSTVPGYNVGRVVACEGENVYRWRTEVLCKQRGLYRLGPHKMQLQDPFGFFAVTVANSADEIVLIYPRVVHLPPVQLPHGNSQGSDRHRRPLLGNMPAATVSDYQRGDSLRHVHWASTARRGRMMVKDLEIEPSGNIWLVMNLDASVQQGEGPSSTLEYGIVVTASLAAELLGGRDQRAVGLLALRGDESGKGEVESGGLVEVLPGVGSAHTWSILSALAPVQAGKLGLAALLASSRNRINRHSTLTVITPIASGNFENDGATQLSNGDVRETDWVAELVHLKGIGVGCSVVLVAPEAGDLRDGEGVQALLARLDIPCTVLVAGAPLPSLLTFRRRRRIVRSTPTGGVVSYEVDEEVG